MKKALLYLAILPAMFLGCKNETKLTKKQDITITQTNKKNNTNSDNLASSDKISSQTSVAAKDFQQTPEPEFEPGCFPSNELLFSGRVLFKDNSPAPNALIKITATPKHKHYKYYPPYATLRTNSQGEFKIGLPKDYSYLVYTYPENGTMQNYNFNWNNAETAPDGSGYRFVHNTLIYAERAISQRFVIKDQNNQPIPDSTLYLYLNGKVTTATAEGNGSFIHHNLPKTSVSIFARAKGYALLYQENFRLPADSSPYEIILTPGGGTIKGKITTADGNPVTSGTPVQLAPNYNDSNPIPNNMMELGFITRTDENGNFAIHSVPPYNVRVFVSDMGGGKYRNIHHNCLEPSFVRLKDFEEKTLDTTVYTGITVHGYIYDKESSSPLAGVPVSTGPYCGDTVTDQNGYYKINNVFPDINLVVNADRYLSTVTHVIPAPKTCSETTVQFDQPMLETVKVSGTITNADGFPVANALVKAKTSNDHLSISALQTRTDSKGNFTLKVLPLTAMALIIDAPQYVYTTTEPFDVGISDLPNKNYILKKGFTVKGSVTTPDSSPVVAATLSSVYRPTTYYYSDGKGNFTLLNASDKENYYISAPGHLTSSFKINIPEELKDGQTSDGLKITMSPTSFIGGRIVLKSKDSATTIPFNASEREHAVSLGLTNFDSRGIIEINVNRDGTFYTDAVAMNTTYMVMLFSKTLEESESIPQEVMSGRNDIVILAKEVEPDSNKEDNSPRTAYLTVKNKKTGKPITNAQIEPYTEDRNVSVSAAPETSGTFLIKNITTVTVFKVSAEGYLPSNVEIRRNTEDTPSYQSVELSALGAIKGKVVDKTTGKPLSNLLVRAYDWDQGAVSKRNAPKHYTTTDNDGNFLILSAETIFTSLSIKPELPLAEYIEEVKVLDGETFDMGTISILQTGTIKGKVFRNDGTPVKNSSVAIKGMSYDGVKKTDDNGEFSQSELIPGKYQIATDPPRLLEVVILESGETKEIEFKSGSVHFTGKVISGEEKVFGYVIFSALNKKLSVAGDITEGEIKLDLDPGKYNITILSEEYKMPVQFEIEIPDVPEYTKEFQLPAGEISGTVVSESGKPLEDYHIKCSSKDDGAVFELRQTYSQTDSKGNFTLNYLPSGIYDLYAWKEDSASGLKTGVVVGQNSTKVKIVIPDKPGSLEHTALDAETGYPVYDAITYIFSVNKGKLVTEGERDDNGKLKLDNIPPGNYTIITTHPDYSDTFHTIEIKADETNKIEDQLNPGGVLIYSIDTPNGLPIIEQITTSIEPIETLYPTPIRERFYDGMSTRETGLPPGTYKFKVYHRGKITEYEFSIIARDVTKMKIDL